MRPFSCISKITESKDCLRASKSLKRNHLSNFSGNQNLNNSLSSISNKSAKNTDAHRSLNIRMLDIKDKKIELKDREIKELKEKIEALRNKEIQSNQIHQNNLEKENELLRQQIKSLEEQVKLKPDIEQFLNEKEQEISTLEFSLKSKYEEILKSKLREKEIEFEHKLNNKANLTERYRQHVDTPSQFNIKPYPRSFISSPESENDQFANKLLEFQSDLRQKLNREYDEKLASAIAEIEDKHKLEIQQIEEMHNESRKSDFNRIKIKCLREIRNEKKEDYYERMKEEMREEIEGEIMKEITEKIRKDFLEDLDNSDNQFNLAKECANPQFTFALCEGMINNENSIFKQMKISCMKELEKQKKIMNYKFKERCEQMCQNIDNEIETTVNERLTEELEIKEQEIRKELKLEQGKILLKEKQKLRNQLQEEFKCAMEDEWNKLNEAKNEFSRLQSKANIKFKKNAEAKKQNENYVKLKEIELQRKINELNEEINILKAQNSEFNKERIKVKIK